MSEKLQQARDELEKAAKAADSNDVRDDIHDTRESFADYVRGDRQPDHAVLDEQLNTLRQARTRANGTTATEINSAIEVVEDYRESIYQDR